MGVLAILIGIFVYTRVTPNDNLVENCIARLTVYVQKAVTKISNWADDYYYQFREKADLEAENQKLRGELNALRDKTIDYYDLKLENARYKKYFDLKKSDKSLQFVEADVIGRGLGIDFDNLMIDAGSNLGISAGDAVITENGFVGSVCRVSGSTASVKTILSANCKVGAAGIESGESGVISGNIRFSERGLTRMEFISAQSKINIGETVVTSGLGGIYPKNLKIGRVTSKSYDDYDSFYYAEIEPFQDIKNTRHVFVITGFSGKYNFENVEIEN